MNVVKTKIRQIVKHIARKWEYIKDRKYVWGGVIRGKYLRLVLKECGDHLVVYGKPTVFEPEKICIGNHFTINDRCQISPRGNVYIGDYVVMSRGSQITAGSLDLTNWVDEKYKERVHIEGDVFIGDGTWLCINSIVLPGVKITGKGVVVAAGAVVTHDIVEDYVVVGGAPAKIVKRLKADHNNVVS